MAPPNGKVCTVGDGIRRKGSMQDGAAGRRVEAGIEGGIHDMRLLWEQYSHEDYWWFLLIDMWNAFNEDNRTAMLWDVRHEWPSNAQVTFNCYRHWATLVMRESNDSSGHFLYIKYGVTQGYPLAIIAYDIEFLPLI